MPVPWSEKVLQVFDLWVSFSKRTEEQEILRGIDLDILPGQTLGLVGESGAGKSLLTLAIMGLLPPGFRVKKGRIEFLGHDLLCDPQAHSLVRGKRIGIIFQDPTASLDPLYRVGSQVAETMGFSLTSSSGKQKVWELFSRVEFRNPKEMAFRYPHQISGGEKQRVMIATALAENPVLLLADEPTASLDVNTGSQIISLLKKIQKDMGLSILFISHNLALVEKVVDSLAIIYAGKILEKGPIREVINQPLHPYTQLLYLARPDPSRKGKSLVTVPGLPKDKTPRSSGCPFFTRCPQKDSICLALEPSMVEAKPNHWVACHRSNLLGMSA